MTVLEKVREALGLKQVNLYAETRLDDGRMMVTEEDSFNEGVRISVIDETGHTTPLDAGEYKCENGITYKVNSDSTIEKMVTEATMSRQALEEPCWEGYEMVGTKIVDGKEVPNCVPIKASKEEMQAVYEVKIVEPGDINKVEQAYEKLEAYLKDDIKGVGTDVYEIESKEAAYEFALMLEEMKIDHDRTYELDEVKMNRQEMSEFGISEAAKETMDLCADHNAALVKLKLTVKNGADATNDEVTAESLDEVDKDLDKFIKYADETGKYLYNLAKSAKRADLSRQKRRFEREEFADLAMGDRTEYYNIILNGLSKTRWGKMIEYIGQNKPKDVAKQYSITVEQAQELSELVDDYIEKTGTLFGNMEKEVLKASGPLKTYIRRLAL